MINCRLLRLNNLIVPMRRREMVQRKAGSKRRPVEM
jgi:hypothetical protein